jgi:hypothetical protein
MRISATILMFAAAACAAFGYWGSSTAAGRRAFDEMDGIIPLFSGFVGAPILLMIAAVLWWRAR